MISPDLRRFGEAVRFRDRAVAAAVAHHERAGLQPSQQYARATFDTIAEMIRADERARLKVMDLFAAEVSDQRRATLVETYWVLRDHAVAYRDTNGYRRAQERAASGNDHDRKQATMHRSFARGIERAAQDIAEMLGVPEHEIERDAVSE